MENSRSRRNSTKLANHQLLINRKYSVEVSKTEILQRINEQLRSLKTNSQIHYSKRKKLLLHLERRFNQIRRTFDSSDHNQQIHFAESVHLIREIKKSIIHEECRILEQRRNEQEQQETNPWSSTKVAVSVIILLVIVVVVATLIRIFLDNMNKIQI